jgi:uncharacterized repeat protein (TIGR03843 family)
MGKIMNSSSGKLVAISEGELTVTGRLVDASNATLYAHVVHEDQEIICIYKPIAGERPLWDFDQGCLAHREFAAYCVSNYLSLDLVPFTVLRDGPYGQGMVQEWIDIDESIDLSEYFSQDRDELRKMALFDAIVNNTDRKIGHLLPTVDKGLFGCDHGVTFHKDDKLRTVLWQWSGKNLTDDEIALLERCKQGLNGELGELLSPLLTSEEIQAFGNRVDRILESQMFPEPSPDWPAVPWPAF